ncbi:BTAD domain-containing putative transcriptional regulator [Nitrospira sp. BLG_1]|uniref:BTAD domain-containing putative transcriptional regulator n=1 Tax=Nitrospira sp. BLG_1 TaxID=3395883 RepID=UPI0039BC74CC
MPHRTTLAKLTPPRLYAITRRERLFTLLNKHHRHHKLIWVAGPPGAGKTSLIASYLAEHKTRTLWYHVDPGDADLATFFHYLAQVAQGAAGRKRLRLPALTPEFMADVPGFTRRFLRELWAKVPLPATVVLDNFQELPANAALHAILPIALTEFPVGATLIVISREDAPAHWAQGLTQVPVGHIRWDDLQLTLEETRTIAASVPGLDQTALHTIHTQTKGWVAGTVLILERRKTGESWTTTNVSETHSGFFAYFAQQVFAQLESRTKTVLLRTALLLWMTGPMAEELSGESGADQVLRELYQRGLFVDRRAETQVTYHYHDLFREFLVNQCLQQYSEYELLDLRRTTAAVAERTGQLDTAVTLYAETNSWDDLSRVIYGSAEKLLSQGRNSTLQRYIGLIQEAERDKRPWLLYWLGISRLVFDPVTARKDLESAYQQFEHNQDIPGLFLSCSGIIQSYYCGADNMAPAIAWGDRLEGLLCQNGGFPSSSVEATVLANLQGLMLACPHHPLLIKLESSIEQTLRSIEDPQKCLSVAIAFIILLLWMGEFRRVRQIMEYLNARLDTVTLPPFLQLDWKAKEATYVWCTRYEKNAGLKIQEALAIAEQSGIHIFKPMIWGQQAHDALAAGNDLEAKKAVDLILAAIQPHQRLALGQCSFYQAGIAFLGNDLGSARKHAEGVVANTVDLCVPFLTATSRIGLAKVLIELGETAKATEQLDAALEYARIMRSVFTEVLCLLAKASLELKERHIDQANETMQKGLRIARENDYLCLDYWWRPKVMADLMAHALEAGIEVEYVRSVIQRRNLRAPSAALTRWPYPITITTLGRFELVMADVPITMLGKTQRKPLELLKYLCTVGEQGLHQDLIEEALWPEADGEAAEQAFRTTLHRLRKLLRHEDAVQLADRHISLDPSLVSLDHMAFQRLARDIDRTDAATIEHTLALYRGHFLHGETAVWVLPIREQLRAQFLTLTEQLGSLLEGKGKVGEAAHRYLCALEVEPTAEVICRRVMTTYVRLGRRSEAIGVYQRFSNALHAKLGVPPTPETVSLYHNIIKR